MKLSLWVLCGVTLLCFGNVRCSRHFLDNDENFLDKTGDGHAVRTEREEGIEWQLYKARNVLDDLTNELSEISRLQNPPREGYLVDQNKQTKENPDGNTDVQPEVDNMDKCADVVCYNKGTCEVKAGAGVCKCESGFTGEMCEIFSDDECKKVKVQCVKTGGKCKSESDSEVICECQTGNLYLENEGCKKKCNDDKDCKNEGKCIGEDGAKTCKCKPGTFGDTCEDNIPECITGGKYGNCKGENGDCVFEGGIVQCKCSDDKSFDEAVGYCKTDYCKKKCGDVKCNGNKFESEGIKCECPSEDEDFIEGEKICKINHCKQVCGTDAKVNCKGDKYTKKEKTDCTCKEEGYQFIDKKCEECKCKNGECKEVEGILECICPPEFGKYEEDVCEACDCGKGANCTFDDYSSLPEKIPFCICPSGSRKVKGMCVVKCNDGDCQNEGNCEGTENYKICKCKSGTTGDMCETIEACKKGGKYEKCVDQNGKCGFKNGQPTCTCLDDKVLNEKAGHCQESFCNEKCGNLKCTGNIFVRDETICICPKEDEDFVDGQCKINFCRRVCGSDERVICKGDKYTDKKETDCTCQSGYLFINKKCQKICKEGDCQNEGKCEGKENSKLCSCEEGTKGDLCEMVEACVKGGKYENCQGKNGQCGFKNKQPMCTCSDNRVLNESLGYCQDKCLGYCQNQGICEVQDKTPVCNCPDEFTGLRCEKKKCDDYCKNGGTCGIQDRKAVCSCPDEYTGDQCEKKKCDDYCKNGGTCEVKEKKPVCSCTDEYTGDQCQKNKCDGYCQNGGTCLVKDKNPVCSCPVGYIGDKCEKYICKGVCQNKGECTVDDDGKPKCECKDGYTGDHCEELNDDKCGKELAICLQSGGTCVKRDGEKVKCKCTEDKDFKDKEGCKTDYCKEKCGNVECVGDKFNRTAVNCTCPNEYQEFIEETKECEITEAKCQEAIANCTDTEGKCILNDKNTVECKCPENKEFVEGAGCKTNYCKEKCGNVECTGERFEENSVKCICPNELQVFEPDEKECKISEENCRKAFKNCMETDGACVLDAAANKVRCNCPKDTEFVQDRGCKTNYCKKKCGTGRARCEGDFYDEDDVKCICPDDNEDFIAENKTCKTNFCRKVCGKDPLIKCENEYVTKAAKDCSCNSDDYVFRNKRCQKKCSVSEDCKYNGTCTEKTKLCECKPGFEGDMCELITKCEKGLYKNCRGKKGECVFEGREAKCKCTDDRKLYTVKGYCEVPCKEGNKCDDSKRTCSGGFCVCKKGYEGDDCDEVSGCKILDEKCKVIGKECVFDDDVPDLKATCKCEKGYKYDARANECKHTFCHPTDPCKPNAVCKDDKSTGTGFCECPDNKYYDYGSGKCEAIDKCLIKKKSCGEHEECKNGVCECKYEKKEKEECKPKRCSPNPCFTGAQCLDDDGSCYCDGLKYYNFKICQDQQKKCNLKDYKENCTCPEGTSRQKDEKECAPAKDKECSRSCGYGICVKSGNDEICKCFTTISEKKNGTCALKTRYCAGGKLQKDFMKCDCKDKYKQAKDGITCILKTCDDSDVKEKCASMGAECKMDWKNDGFECECPKGLEIGDNGKCTDPCSIERNILKCAEDKKICFNTLSSKNKGAADCSCPPTLKKTNAMCNEKAEFVYLIENIPVLKKNYETKSGINIAVLSYDLTQSIKQSFSERFESGYINDFRVEGSIVNCSVWVNFKTKPDLSELEKIKAVPRKFSKLCDDCDENAVVWAPNLLLSDKGLQGAKIKDINFCSPEVKDRFCGKGTLCDKNKCSCEEGFRLIEMSVQKFGDYHAQRCEDINECAMATDNCTKNTKCVNTEGSFKCVCEDGYKKETTPTDPENDKGACVDLCTNSPCKKGKCVKKGNTFDCECQPGAAGALCDREDLNYAGAKKSTVVVGAVLGTLLAVGALAVLFFIIKRRGGICVE